MIAVVEAVSAAITQIVIVAGNVAKIAAAVNAAIAAAKAVAVKNLEIKLTKEGMLHSTCLLYN